jgi:hypothetical protein
MIGFDKFALFVRIAKLKYKKIILFILYHMCIVAVLVVN